MGGELDLRSATTPVRHPLSVGVASWECASRDLFAEREVVLAGNLFDYPAGPMVGLG